MTVGNLFYGLLKIFPDLEKHFERETENELIFKEEDVFYLKLKKAEDLEDCWNWTLFIFKDIKTSIVRNGTINNCDIDNCRDLVRNLSSLFINYNQLKENFLTKVLYKDFPWLKNYRKFSNEHLLFEIPSVMKLVIKIEPLENYEDYEEYRNQENIPENEKTESWKLKSTRKQFPSWKVFQWEIELDITYPNGNKGVLFKKESDTKETMIIYGGLTDLLYRAVKGFKNE